MPRIGLSELIFVFILIVLWFGIIRVAKVGGKISNAVRSFYDKLKAEDENPTDQQKKG